MAIDDLIGISPVWMLPVISWVLPVEVHVCMYVWMYVHLLTCHSIIVVQSCTKKKWKKKGEKNYDPV